ncbi:hypothetical protein POM88_005345 [Heracleum sosnowskyi]|uniref:Uncharacterized protein n=1 Tax=Heracleum sosnowskyi TaxID=360622 RepID=A0AAD8JJR0_9APIA|nr:hypothetical protein POM88_005345 [Heracleum sosnowskyi]
MNDMILAIIAVAQLTTRQLSQSYLERLQLLMYSRRTRQLEGEKMGFGVTRDEVPESVDRLGDAAVSSSQTFQKRVALELNDHFFVSSSVEYHGDKVLGSVHDEHKERYVTLTKPPVIKAHGILGQALFDVCVPTDVENWDIKPSPFLKPPSSCSRKGSPFAFDAQGSNIGGSYISEKLQNCMIILSM